MPAVTNIAQGVLAAVPFFWLGLIVAISGIEAPIKFRAPGITRALGLGIGRLVFAALNRVEIALALVLLIARGLLGLRLDTGTGLLAALLIVVAVQTAWLRPALDRRATAILAGQEPPHSQHHILYAALEVVKALLLVAFGIVTLRA